MYDKPRGVGPSADGILRLEPYLFAEKEEDLGIVPFGDPIDPSLNN